MNQPFVYYFVPFDILMFLIISFYSFDVTFIIFIFNVVIEVIYDVVIDVDVRFIIAIIFGLSWYGYPFLLINVKVMNRSYSQDLKNMIMSYHKYSWKTLQQRNLMKSLASCLMEVHVVIYSQWLIFWQILSILQD